MNCLNISYTAVFSISGVSLAVDLDLDLDLDLFLFLFSSEMSICGVQMSINIICGVWMSNIVGCYCYY